LVQRQRIQADLKGLEGKNESSNGSFFMGEAYLNYNIIQGDICYRHAQIPVHMLGYAWSGPQAACIYIILSE
jgi:hypothetical protein